MLQPTPSQQASCCAEACSAGTPCPTGLLRWPCCTRCWATPTSANSYCGCSWPPAWATHPSPCCSSAATCWDRWAFILFYCFICCVQAGRLVMDHSWEYLWEGHQSSWLRLKVRLGPATKVAEVESAALEVWPFWMRWVKREVGLFRNGSPTLFLVLWPAMIALIKNEPMSAHTGPNLVFVSWPTVIRLIKMVHQSCVYKHQDTHKWIHVCMHPTYMPVHTCRHIHTPLRLVLSLPFC